MTSHIRSALNTDESLTIPFVSGRLALGIWQGLYVFEHGTCRCSRTAHCPAFDGRVTRLGISENWIVTDLEFAGKRASGAGFLGNQKGVVDILARNIDVSCFPSCPDTLRGGVLRRNILPHCLQLGISDNLPRTRANATRRGASPADSLRPQPATATPINPRRRASSH